MEIKLTLHIDTVNAVLTALGKMPFEFAAPHINIIQQQAVPQVKEREAQATTEENPGLSD